MTTLDELIDAQLAIDAETERKEREAQQARAAANKAAAIEAMQARLRDNLGDDLYRALGPMEYEAATFRECGEAYHLAERDAVRHVIATAPVYLDMVEFTYWPGVDDSEDNGLCSFRLSGTDKCRGYSDRATVLRALAEARQFEREHLVECVE